MTNTTSPDRDRPVAEAAVSALPQRSFGAWLRTQREARGISLREIADASKISVRYLEALEQDRFEILPAPVFVRGFLREYARIVGLDPDEVVNLFLLASGAEDGEEEEPEQERLARRRAGGPPPLVWLAVLAVAVLILLGLAALVWYWAARRSPATEPPPALFEAEPAAGGSAAAPTGPPATPSAVSPARLDPGGAAAPVGAGSRRAAPELTTEPAEGPIRVQLDFEEDCWVELVVDGGRRAGELRTSGEVLTLDADQSVLLTLGNPAGVRVEVDGRPLELPGGGERVVRDLLIDRRSLAAARPPDPSR